MHICANLKYMYIDGSTHEIHINAKKGQETSFKTLENLFLKKA